MNKLSGVFAAAVACTLSYAAPAGAGTPKAWTVASKSLPDQTAVAIGVDTLAVAKSATFQKLFPIVLGKNQDVSDALTLIKTACKVDPLTVIKSVAVGLDATQDDGAVFLTVPDMTPAKLTSCLKDVAKSKGIAADQIAKMQITTDGNITSLSDGQGKGLSFAWLGGDTVAIVPKHIDDKAALKTWTGGGFAKSAVSKLMGKVKTDATVFVASSASKQVDATHTLKVGYGWASIGGGNIALEFHGDLGDEAGAKGLATDANTQLDQLRKNPPLPAVAGMLKTATVTSAGSELVGKATVSEKDFGDLVGMATGM